MFRADAAGIYHRQRRPWKSAPYARNLPAHVPQLRCRALCQGSVVYLQRWTAAPPCGLESVSPYCATDARPLQRKLQSRKGSAE